jgi:hypothetical protein
MAEVYRGFLKESRITLPLFDYIYTHTSFRLKKITIEFTNACNLNIGSMNY